MRLLKAQRRGDAVLKVQGACGLLFFCPSDDDGESDALHGTAK